MSEGVEARYVVLGAGPAGLQVAYFLQQAGVDHVVLEREAHVASFFHSFPRSRELISFNKVHSLFDDPEIRLRWDWNSLLTHDYGFLFEEYSKRLYPKAGELVEYLEGFHREYDLDVRFGTRVEEVCPRTDGEEGWRLATTSGETYRCRVLVVATGFGGPYVPSIPGIRHAVGYEEAPFEAEPYTDQRVLIVGKGNSAMEVAEVALESAAVVHVASPTPLTLAYSSRHPGNIRSNHSRLLDAYHLKTLNSILNCRILRIAPLDESGDGGPYRVTAAYTGADGEVDDLVYDRIVRCTGFRFDDSIFDPPPDTVLDGRLPAITPYWESPSHPGLFFAGTLMQARDFKRASSAFIDGFRYNARTLHRHLMERYEGRPFPRSRMPHEPGRLADSILERASRSSGLWTQFGYLCDLFVVGDGAVDWFREIPLESVREGDLREEPHYYTLTFEWGTWTGDPMAIERHPSAAQAHRSVFLHPVVRRFRHADLVDEHHVLEDLYGIYAADRERGAVLSHDDLGIAEYHRSHHRAPLVDFFESHREANARAS